MERNKILIVDYDAICQTLSSMINRHITEKKALISSNVDDAFKKIESKGNEVCLIIMDVEMAAEKNFRLFESIRHSQSLNDIPIILLNNYEPQDTLDGCYKLMTTKDSLLEKPFDIQKLIGFIRGLVIPLSDKMYTRTGN